MLLDNTAEKDSGTLTRLLEARHNFITPLPKDQAALPTFSGSQVKFSFLPVHSVSAHSGGQASFGTETGGESKGKGETNAKDISTFPSFAPSKEKKVKLGRELEQGKHGNCN